MTMSEFTHVRSEYGRQLANLEGSYQNGNITDADYKARYRSLILNYLLHTRPDDEIDVDVFIIKNGADELRSVLESIKEVN